MPHPQPGSAPPAGTADAEPAEPGSGTRSDDPLTTSGRDPDEHRAGHPQPQRAAAASDRTAAEPPRAAGAPPAPTDAEAGAAAPPAGLLDAPGSWPPVPTGAGLFRLVPVGLPGDLPLLTGWMNDPVVAAFWELAGPERVTEAHVRPQLDGDGRSMPCLGVLDGVPMSYWELYRADLDPLARYCRVRPHDTGVHLLVGGAAHRGRGLGTLLLRTVADLVLAQRPRCPRVLAEPDVRNAPSLAAFLSAGFRRSAEIELPGKRAALMVRDREPRHAL
ncbi:GNAT family N-acetyltransferase [Streptomyces qinglanensis]|uniref:GNAT family N-acetyltransferase n=1 Tax=Streptomyces qinglanensis TaxID=943816 RepID=UPI003D735E00